MGRGIQVEFAARVRAAGIPGDTTLRLAPADARRLVHGLPASAAAWGDIGNLEHYPGTRDAEGVVRYAVDVALPRGAGFAGEATPIPLMTSPVRLDHDAGCCADHSGTADARVGNCRVERAGRMLDPSR